MSSRVLTSGSRTYEASVFSEASLSPICDAILPSMLMRRLHGILLTAFVATVVLSGPVSAAVGMCRTCTSATVCSDLRRNGLLSTCLCKERRQT